MSSVRYIMPERLQFRTIFAISSPIIAGCLKHLKVYIKTVVATSKIIKLVKKRSSKSTALLIYFCDVKRTAICS